jgi:aryl-alcohol dehydrogenase-like predicted oxidoreductase
VPIAGTTRLHRLEENLAAANVVPTAIDVAEITRAAAEIQIEGYPVHLPAPTDL